MRGIFKELWFLYRVLERSCYKIFETKFIKVSYSATRSVAGIVSTNAGYCIAQGKKEISLEDLYRLNGEEFRGARCLCRSSSNLF